MANTLIHKRSGTVSAAPSALEFGELALNYADGKVFWKDSTSAIQSFTFQAYATAASPSLTGSPTLTSVGPLFAFVNNGYSRTWRIGSSGSSSFLIQDQTGSTIPFLIQAGAPNDTISIGSTGTVGVGTTALSTAKMFVSGASGVNQFVASVPNVGGVFINSFAGGAIYHLAFAGGTSAATIYAIGTQSNIPTGIYTNNAERVRVSETGVVSLLAGQLKFPAAANLSADANTLDDYEEGTWTPTFTASTTNPTVTYGSNTYGVYVKVGKVVFFHGRVVLTALTSAGSGNLRVGGLPFTADGITAGGYGCFVISYKNGWTTNGPSAAHVEYSNAVASLYTSGATSNTPLPVSSLSATSDILFSGFYHTAQ